MPAPDRAPLLRLAALGAAALAVRLAVVAWLPDADTDAYGHYAIGRALVADPTNLAAHWVWLPAYHYLLAALIRAGVSFGGVRLAVALLQVVAPFLLYDLVLRRGGDEGRAEDARAAELAAAALTIAPLPNLLATSAQQETTFALLVLSAAWALGRRRAALAGGLLALASLVRYEAWGAVLALAGLHVAARLRTRRLDPGLASFLIPAAAVAAWLLLRRVADGEWLLFVRQTREFSSGVRGTTGFSALLDAVWFPLVLPAAALGPTLLLVPVGLRRVWLPVFGIPVGLLAFLFASYAGRGALGLPRYYTSLVPFACIALADGALRLRARASAVVPASLAALALTTTVHLAVLARRSLARAPELRGYEAAAERGPSR